MDDLLDLVGSTADGVFAVDAGQRIILWNEAARSILGFPAEEVLGRPCYEVFGGRDAAGRLLCQKGCRTHAMASRHELPPTQDLATQTRDGQEVCLNVTTVVVPMRMRSSPFVVIHVFRDVSQQKHLERLVQRLVSSVTTSAWRERPEGSADPPGVAAPGNLTLREVEVLRLMASGASTKAISDRLCISAATVKNHTRHILGKLDAHSRLEAVAVASRHGLTWPEGPTNMSRSGY